MLIILLSKGDATDQPQEGYELWTVYLLTELQASTQSTSTFVHVTTNMHVWGQMEEGSLL